MQNNKYKDTYLELFSYKHFISVLSIMLDNFNLQKSKSTEEDCKIFTEKIKYNLEQHELIMIKKKLLINKIKI